MDTCPVVPISAIDPGTPQELLRALMRTHNGQPVSIDEIGSFVVAADEQTFLHLLTRDGDKSTHPENADQNPIDRVRTQLRASFNPSRTRPIAEAVLREVSRLIDETADASSLELVGSVFVPAATRVLFTCLGIDPACAHESATKFLAAQKTSDRSSLQKKLQTVVGEEVLPHLSADGTLRQLQASHKLQEAKIIDIVMLLMMVGIEPVANLTAITLERSLRTAPLFYDQRHAENSYHYVVENDSPIYPGIYRTSSTTMAVDGYEHPPGTQFLIPSIACDGIGSKREPRRSLTFGAGNRRCIAEHLSSTLVVGMVDTILSAGASAVKTLTWRVNLPRGISAMSCTFDVSRPIRRGTP
ncbi:cytochrome P450 [Rhodococcus erythropolis]|uniref:cytochrome P450 n=1 Tax=Rhodococcus erythropolis TaxID=1833 RepID=UPI001E282A96|nr:MULTISPECIES: cytochrome P450 [Rhodococcus erythropolis group]MCD2104878.1 cytochrome P450 [Rhodococcus qingshengii]MCZ4524994.1 cytochrome P450 [Rhodococcus erythropolis]